MAMQIRCGTYPTRARIAKWRPSQTFDASCPLCRSPKDTIGHRLASSLNRSIKNQICARHGHDVHALATEIRSETLGECAMFCDAECNERYTVFPDSLLPSHMQTSRPDIFLLQTIRARDLGNLPPGRRRDPRVVLHVIEVTYTSDLYVHGAVPRNFQQHDELCRNLRAFGWQNVRIHTFVVGHTGVMLVMRQDNANILTQHGTSQHRVTPFLAELAIRSLHKSCVILSCFPSANLQAHTRAPSVTPPMPTATAASPPLLPMTVSPPTNALVEPT